MAQRVQVMLVCDLHGDETPASQTLEFALDGAAYEIDLCDEHAGQLRDSMAGFVGVARRAGGGRGALSPNARSGNRRRRRSSGSGDAARIREWARSQGLAVPERGRIPAELAERYAAAHH